MPMTDEQRRALDEVSQKSLAQIQAETARTWAHRAWASKKLAAQARENGDWSLYSTLTRDATEYEHEALEHAALSGDDDLLAEVRALL